MSVTFSVNYDLKNVNNNNNDNNDNNDDDNPFPPERISCPSNQGPTARIDDLESRECNQCNVADKQLSTHALGKFDQMSWQNDTIVIRIGLLAPILWQVYIFAIDNDKLTPISWHPFLWRWTVWTPISMSFAYASCHQCYGSTTYITNIMPNWLL